MEVAALVDVMSKRLAQANEERRESGKSFMAVIVFFRGSGIVDQGMLYLLVTTMLPSNAWQPIAVVALIAVPLPERWAVQWVATMA